jgi:hypothetical protein
MDESSRMDACTVTVVISSMSSKKAAAVIRACPDGLALAVGHQILTVFSKVRVDSHVVLVLCFVSHPPDGFQWVLP